MINHHHGKITAAVPEPILVQDTLGSVPLGAGYNGSVVARLVILVLFPVIPAWTYDRGNWKSRFLRAKHIATVALIAHLLAATPLGVHRVLLLTTYLLQPRFPSQIGQRFRDFRQELPLSSI